MPYVDGFVLPVPKDKVDLYKEKARLAGKVMADPRLKDMFKDLPVDGKRMIFGGFESFLQL